LFTNKQQTNKQTKNQTNKQTNKQTNIENIYLYAFQNRLDGAGLCPNQVIMA
jgi:hypothetical protein